MSIHTSHVYICRVADELKKEAKMCILKHDNIVALFAIIFEPDCYGIVMEYVLNGHLEDYICNYDV